MKKQLIILAIAMMASQLSTATISEQDDRQVISVSETINDNFTIEHLTGNGLKFGGFLTEYIINGTYKEKALKNIKVSANNNTIILAALDGSIIYEAGQLNFTGYCSLLLPSGKPMTGTTTALTIPTDFHVRINNITSPEAFEKQAQDWIKTTVSEQLSNVPKTYLDTIPNLKELLTQALPLAVKKWKELIVIFKADIQEQLQQLQSLQKKDNPQAAMIEEAKAKLEQMKAKLTNFK